MALIRFDIMTLFPEYVDHILSESIIGRARNKGIVEICAHNIRDYSKDKFRRVDDTPYGGGKGMLMRPDPVCDCFDAICKSLPERPYTVYLSPKGRPFDQKKAVFLAQKKNLVLLCGHYEGIDQRAIDEIVDEEISLGDFVVTGGEVPACIVVDAVCRLVDGVLTSPECYEEESFSDGLLEYPQYTRPIEYRGRRVPEVLVSGHHKNIKEWRLAQALRLTRERRPDLLSQYPEQKKGK